MLPVMARCRAHCPFSKFLSIPVEIRTRIYSFVLRADCSLEGHGGKFYCAKQHICPQSFLGCTKILSVCRQVHDEAVELLHNLKQEPILMLNGKSKHVLRHPLEFGKPGFFFVCKRTCKCYLPKAFDELQIIRMRKFAIDIIFPDTPTWLDSTDIASIANNVRETAAALGKSKTMKALRIRLSRLDTSYFNSQTQLEAHQAMRDALLPLIESALRAGYRLIIQDGRDVRRDHATEPLVQWMVDRAKASEVNTTRLEPEYLEEPGQDFDDFFDFSTNAESWITSSDNPPSTPDNDSPHTFDNDPPNTLDLPRPSYPEMLDDDIPLPMTPAAPYELVPQCRNKHCNAYFRNKSELAAHLLRFPSHKQPFVKKHFNAIHPFAMNGRGDRKCWTCAKPYSLVRALDQHLKKSGHRRHGIVPKYREDNGRWDERWRRNKKRTGWL